MIAGIISHVPGGLGRVRDRDPAHAAERAGGCAARLAARLSRRLLPRAAGVRRRCCSAPRNSPRSAARSPRAQELAALYIAPVVPQVAGALTFLAGALLLFSGATPAWMSGSRSSTASCRWPCSRSRTWPAASIGLGLLMLARALFRRVQAAYHITFWLLAAGICASLLKGLDFEEATAPRPRPRRADARAARLLPADGDPLRALHAGRGSSSIVGVIAMAVWIGVLAYRHVELLATSCGGRSRSMPMRRACCAPRSRSSCSAPPTCC